MAQEAYTDFLTVSADVVSAEQTKEKIAFVLGKDFFWLLLPTGWYAWPMRCAGKPQPKY